MQISDFLVNKCRSTIICRRFSQKMARRTGKRKHTYLFFWPKQMLMSIKQIWPLKLMSFLEVQKNKATVTLNQSSLKTKTYLQLTE